MKSLLFLTFLLLGFTGCQTQEETKTVEYYKQNKQERAIKLKECKNNPGELEKTPNCINAKQADIQSLKGKASGLDDLIKDLKSKTPPKK